MGEHFAHATQLFLAADEASERFGEVAFAQQLPGVAALPRARKSKKRRRPS